MAGKLVGTAIVPGSVTVAKLANDVSAVIQAGGGPKVISVGYPGDDTAANSVGAQTITVTGTGFNPNVKVFIGSISGGTEAPTVSRANANSLSFTTPALTQGLYQLYVVNSDGGVGTFPRFQVSGDPAWVTSSSLGQFVVSAGMNKQLEAISDSTITYTLANGSSLPAGTSLASNGLISGTLTSPPGAETTYNFSVVATDQENQNSERAFSYTGILFTFSISPAVNGQSNIALTTGSTLNLTTNGAYTITPLGDFSANVQVWGAGGGELLALLAPALLLVVQHLVLVLALVSNLNQTQLQLLSLVVVAVLQVVVQQRLEAVVVEVAQLAKTLSVWEQVVMVEHNPLLERVVMVVAALALLDQEEMVVVVIQVLQQPLVVLGLVMVVSVHTTVGIRDLVVAVVVTGVAVKVAVMLAASVEAAVRGT